MEASVTIAISTMGRRINGIKLPDPRPGVHYLIVHQSAHDSQFSSRFSTYYRRTDVTYHRLESIGLSKSRNFALINAATDYLHLMDDDVEFDPDNILELAQSAQQDSTDIAIAHFQYINGEYSKSKRSGFGKIKSYFSACSIELCISQRVVREGILFDENFGLGSKHPSGEELIFLMDAHRKKMKVRHYNICIGTHPPITSGMDFFNSNDKIAAKREMFSRAFGVNHHPYKYIFFIKKIPILLKNQALLRFVRTFFVSS